MDFKAASNAHREWKIKLRTFVAGTGPVLDEVMVRSDSNCALGQWLKGLPAARRAEPLVAELIETHARFHQCAAEVVVTVKAGRKEEALKMLDAGTPFSDASFKVVGLIGRVAER